MDNYETDHIPAADMDRTAIEMHRRRKAGNGWIGYHAWVGFDGEGAWGLIEWPGPGETQFTRWTDVVMQLPRVDILA